MINDKKRIKFLDYMKIVAIIMVISLHASLWNTNFITNNTFSTYFQYSLRLIMEGVPIFLLVNGYLKLSKKYDLKKHISKTTKLFIIYCIWVLILTIILSIINKNAITFSSVIELFLQSSSNNPYTGILWFLRYLILIYLFFPIIKYLFDNNYKLFKYLFIILIIFTFEFNAIYLIVDLINYKGNYQILILLKNFIDSFNIKVVDNIFLVYFMTGGIIYKEKDKYCNKKILIIGIISWIVAVVYGIVMSKLNNTLYPDNYNYSQVMLMFFILGLMYISTKIDIKNKNVNKLTSSISNNSMGIYLIHTIVITIINIFYPIINFNFITRLLITFAILIISWIISVIMRKIPMINKIIRI